MQEHAKQQLTERFAELVEQLNQRMHCEPPDDWAELGFVQKSFVARRKPETMWGIDEDFSTQPRTILAKPLPGRAQINQFGVGNSCHGPTMLHPFLLKLNNFHCGAAQFLVKSRPFSLI